MDKILNWVWELDLKGKQGKNLGKQLFSKVKIPGNHTIKII